jgi:hypothetical protein
MNTGSFADVMMRASPRDSVVYHVNGRRHVCVAGDARRSLRGARICVHVARCARDGAGGGVASLRVADMRRRSCGWATCWPLATRWHHTSDRAAHTARTRAPGPHGRSLGERPRSARTLAGRASPALGDPASHPLPRVLRQGGIRKGAAPVHRSAHGYNRGGSAPCPLRGHPQASPVMWWLGPRCMGPRRIGGWRGASRAGGEVVVRAAN